jgi:hypothetical protein
MNKSKRISAQRGAALAMVLQLTVVGALMVGAVAYLTTSQHKFNLRTLQSERALWVAETGVQRFISGLRHENDCIDWSLSPADLNSTCTGQWLGSWVSVKDENGRVLGEYRVSILPGSSTGLKRIKSEGKTFLSKDGGVEVNMTKRVIGVELTRFSLDNFAIASNNQLGGSRINGGARIHGGIFTSGRLGLDASSTGIYNDFTDLQTAQNFQGYTTPAGTPRGEVYVYRDNTTNPPPNPNGGIELAAQSALGTNTNPMEGIHTDPSVVDPGVGTPPAPSTVGDGVVGNGQDTQVFANKKDHTLPSVNFPDASANSAYMQARLAEAQANGCVRGSAISPSDLILDAATVASPFGVGCGSNFAYTVSGGTRQIVINGPVFMYGNLTLKGPIVYQGIGVIFVIGNVIAEKGLEPQVPASYPNTNAIGIVASGDLSLTEGSGSSAKYAGSFFGNNSVNVQKCKIFGNVFGGTLNLPTSGTRPDIYVQPEVRAKLGVPMPDFNNTRINKDNWWEMYGSAAK